MVAIITPIFWRSEVGEGSGLPSFTQLVSGFNSLNPKSTFFPITHCPLLEREQFIIENEAAIVV